MKKKLLVLICIIGMLITGCGNSLYESASSGYIPVYSVEGFSFDMPENFLSQATAVTDILEDEDYSTGTYLYKDGKTTYLMFNISSLVVIVQNTTSYNFQNATDKETALTSYGMAGIWFDKKEKKLEYKESKKKDVYKIILSVEADVSINTGTYNSFIGKMASVQSGNMECSLFIGSLSESSTTKRQEEIINHVVKSLAVCEKEEAEDSPFVRVQDNPALTTESKNEGNKENEGEIPVNVGDVSAGNYSDMYHLLSLGDNGIYHTLASTGAEVIKGNIVIEQLYTGENAKKVIEAYCKTADCPYEYEEAPDGSSWHLIKYKTTISPQESYTDIRIEGFDSGKLKYRGVPHSTRTHDILNAVKEENGWYIDLYCYYAVPNGCKEYMLECGEYINSNITSACYYINCDN